MPRRATSTGSPTPLPGSGSEGGHARALADDLQLVDRVGPLQVARHQQRRVALPLEPRAELARERGLAGALQTREHDHARRLLGQPQPPRFAAEDRDELLVDDLDDLLRRVQRTGDLGALGPLLDPRDERADHRQRDIGLQQRDADLARGGVDIGIGEPALAAQVGQRAGEALGEAVKHPSSLPGRCDEAGVPATYITTLWFRNAHDRPPGVGRRARPARHLAAAAHPARRAEHGGRRDVGRPRAPRTTADHGARRDPGRHAARDDGARRQAGGGRAGRARHRSRRPARRARQRHRGRARGARRTSPGPRRGPRRRCSTTSTPTTTPRLRPPWAPSPDSSRKELHA